MTQEKEVLIALSGCSSSGKTTIAKLTSKLIPHATLIHQDDFYKHDEDVPMNLKYNIRDWDSPDALDMDLFASELEIIRQTGNISSKLIHNNNVDDLSKFNLSPGFVDSLRDEYAQISPKLKIVIVDGFMMFNNDAIRSKFDLKLLIRAPYRQLKDRRAARSGYQTLDSFWVDPPYYFDDFVYKSYASSHSKLFKNNDVEGQLDTENNGDIKDFMNNDEVPIQDTLEWVCREITDYCKKIRDN